MWQGSGLGLFLFFAVASVLGSSCCNYSACVRVFLASSGPSPLALLPLLLIPIPPFEPGGEIATFLFAVEASKALEVRLSSFQIAEFLCELGNSRGGLAFIIACDNLGRIQALNLKGCKFGEQLKRRRLYNAVGSPVVLFRRTT